MSNLTTEEKEARKRYYREQRQRYYAEHPEARQKQLESQRRWREKNKAHCAEYMQKWRAAHPEKNAEYQKAFWERKAAECAAEKIDTD